jgi:hypothetical protein
MTKNTLWKALSGRLSREHITESDQIACCATGEHRGPLIAVAGNGQSTARMCTHHAMAWAESNLCRDVAEHNSSASLAAMSLWVSSGSDLASAAA